jgi:hypothetical protein
VEDLDTHRQLRDIVIDLGGAKILREKSFNSNFLAVKFTAQILHYYP